jgi:hypothetical protein
LRASAGARQQFREQRMERIDLPARGRFTVGLGQQPVLLTCSHVQHRHTLST